MDSEKTEKPTNEGSSEAPAINEYFSFYSKLYDKITYLMEFFYKKDSIEIKAKSLEEVDPPLYKGNFTKENFQKFHKFFRQFDSIEEIYDILKNIGLEKIIFIIHETNSLKLKIEIPSIIKNKPPNEVIIMLFREDMNTNELLNQVIEKTKEIDILKKKIDYLYQYLDIKEYDIDSINLVNEASNKIFNAINSKIFKSHNEILFISQGIEKSTKKAVKNMELIYRASRDGDSSKSFHSKCDGKSNTLTVIKSSVGKRFGGFSVGEWSTEQSYSKDENAFLFSIDDKQFYFIKKEQSDYAIFSNPNYGPAFGKGPDFYISSNCRNNSSFIKQESFDYNGKTDTLVGGKKFSAIDYEIYQINF